MTREYFKEQLIIAIYQSGALDYTDAIGNPTGRVLEEVEYVLEKLDMSYHKFIEENSSR